MCLLDKRGVNVDNRSPISKRVPVSTRVDAAIPLGGEQYTSSADYLLMAGFLVYEASRAPAGARLAARRILTAVLHTAAARGFPHTDVLETLMSNREKSFRVYQLAVDAAAAVGDAQAFVEVLQKAGVSAEGDL